MDTHYIEILNKDKRQLKIEGLFIFREQHFFEEPGFGCGSGRVLAPSSVWKFNYWNDDQTDTQKKQQKTQRKPDSLNNCFILL